MAPWKDKKGLMKRRTQQSSEIGPLVRIDARRAFSIGGPDGRAVSHASYYEPSWSSCEPSFEVVRMNENSVLVMFQAKRARLKK